MILIKEIFRKDITRNINGVVKVEQDKEETLAVELDEYVVTKEIEKHFYTFFGRYVESLNKPTDDIGLWISGFFGSGKSHLLKMFGEIIGNKEYSGKKATEYFKEKLQNDQILLGNIEASGKYPTDIIMFNIDAIGDQDSKQKKDKIYIAFLKKFNELLGFSKDDLKVADFERDLWKQKKYEEFKDKYKTISGRDWEVDRNRLAFKHKDFLAVIADMHIEGIDRDSAERWIRSDYEPKVTPENFANLLKEYLDEKGKNHRLMFLVDEIGQYIGDNSDLMLNLQTVVEEIGIKLRGRVWVGVTSQQNMDAIFADNNIKKNDFSKIQGRFKTILNLSSANIDEVIKKRILEKSDTSRDTLGLYYEDKRIEIQNLIRFTDGTAEMKFYKDTDDFIKTYPFIPYQFNLLQKVLEKVRTLGHSGKHISRGERSILGATQEATLRVKDLELGALIPFQAFYSSIESFLEDTAKRTIINASQNMNLKDFDVEVLKLLFLIRGVEEIKSNVENIATLMVSNVADLKLELEKKIRDSLFRLEKEYLIQRNGNEFYFLTDDEQDINKEIKSIEIDYTRVIDKIWGIIFEDIYDTKAFYMADNGASYQFNKMIDNRRRQGQNDELSVNVLTPKAEIYDASLEMHSQKEPQTLFIKLADEDNYYAEMKEVLQIQEYITKKSSTNTNESRARIIEFKNNEVKNRLGRIRIQIESAIAKATVFVFSRKLEFKVSNPKEVFNKGLEELVKTVYSRNSLVKKHYSDQSVKGLITTDVSAMKLFDMNNELVKHDNREAFAELRMYFELLSDRDEQITYKKVVDKFSSKPFGWQIIDIAGLVAELFMYSEIELKLDGENLEKGRDSTSSALLKTSSANQEKLIIKRRKVIDIEIIRKVIKNAKEILGSSNVYSEDSVELQKTLKGTLKLSRQNYANHLRHYENESKYQYPGKKVIEEWGEIITEVVDKPRDEKELFEKFLKEADYLHELKEKVDEVNSFFSNSTGFPKKKHFDSAVKEIEKIEDNKNFIGELIHCEEVKLLEAILTKKNPYRDIKDIPELIQKIEGKINEIVEKEKEALVKKVEARQSEFIANANSEEELIKEAEKQYSALKTTIQNTNDLRVADHHRTFSMTEAKIKDNFKTKVEQDIIGYEKEVINALSSKENVEKLRMDTIEKFNKFKTEIKIEDDYKKIGEIRALASEEKENLINMANGQAPKKERFIVSLKVLSKKNIEKEEEVDAYIESMKQELETLREIMKKAIRENKRVDI